MRLEILSTDEPHPDYDEFVLFNPYDPTLSYADGSITEVRAANVLNLFSYEDTEEAFREIHRVLAPGGHAYIEVPNAKKIMRSWLSSGLDQEAREAFPNKPTSHYVSHLLFGGASRGGMMFSSAALVRYVWRSGLRIVSLDANGDRLLRCWTEKPLNSTTVDQLMNAGFEGAF